MRIANLIVLFSFFLAGCPLTDSKSNPPSFDLSCDLSNGYAAAREPLRYETQQSYKATAIVVHGKSGSPLATHLQSLVSDLNDSGYDVVAPYMPWSGSEWNGTLCEAMAHLDSIISDEQTAGNSVVLIGHSLGGPVVLAYSALEGTSNPIGVVPLAPGHAIHHSKTLATQHAASISSAKNMISQGQGDQSATFYTYNTGTLQDITTTPDIYLSFHDTAQFPNIVASLAIIDIPILWLAGSDDRLTEVMDNNFGIIDQIPDGENNIYKIITGDHLSLVSGVTSELDLWFGNLSNN